MHPYKFLAYFYYCLNLKPYEYDATDIMDSIAIDVLLLAGNLYVDRMNFPDYVPEKDGGIIREVDKWKTGKYSR